MATYEHLPPGLHARVDSDRTDESPFGSALTTPVDEDVVLFSGIEQRLSGKTLVSHEDAYLDSRAGGIDEHAFSKSFANVVAIEGLEANTVKISKPSLEEPPIKETTTWVKAPSSGNPLEPSTKDILSLLPFSHQSASLDDLARANDCFSSLQEYSFRTLAPIALRILIFLPWCIIAGASILLFPLHLEMIVFQPGFVTSPQGIHRYAFWSTVVKELVGAFIASLLVLLYTVPKVGVPVLCAAITQFVFAWQDFRVNCEIPLGEDDRQSLYYIWKFHASGETLGLREDEKGFYAMVDGAKASE
ncbi:hypothetical protein H0H87_009874 [Tephrocybe sp. NHM501043]|nr:hypothetical protein H0H87_009874 [Tephrocybe sp. NHM501043]